MNLLNKLRSLGYDIASDATPVEIKETALAAVEDEAVSFTLAEYKALQAQDDQIAKDRKDFAQGIVDGVAKANAGLGESIGKALADQLVALRVVGSQSDLAGETAALSEDEEDRELDRITEKAVKAAHERIARNSAGGENTGSTVLAAIASGAGTDEPRVKSVYDRFNSKSRELIHQKGLLKGQRVHDIDGVPMNEASELENVKMWAFFKLQLGLDLSDLEKQLCTEMVEKDAWCNLPDQNAKFDGMVKGQLPQELRDRWKHWINNPRERALKASLLDDSTSGGENAVPIFYDMRGIVEPLVTGELSSLVTITDIPRGSTVQNFTMGNVTVVKTAEGTGITPFDATSLIAAKTYTVFPASVIIDVGLDFLQDAVPQLGNLLRDRIMGAFQQYVDEQIWGGDGTTEPLGILVASNVVDVDPTNVGGPWTLADLITLFFGVNKAHREAFGPNRRLAFAMSDTSNKRFRQLTSGISGDTRPYFGGSLGSYELFGEQVKVPAAANNVNVMFGNWTAYHWYRRQAPQFRLETGGRANALSNIGNVVGRMRNAGAPDRGQYFALIDDGQT